MVGHPVLGMVEEFTASLEMVVDVNPVFMTTLDKADALRALTVVETRVAELRLRIMATATDVAAEHGDKTIAGWLARECRLRRADAANDLKLAVALDRDYPRLAVALREGAVGLEQARVVVRSLDELDRDHVPRDAIAKAETALVGYANQFGPVELRRLGHKILAVIDPDTAEAQEHRRLVHAERHADETQRLSLRPVGDGTTKITGLLPDHVAARLATYLHAFTNPRLADGTARTTVSNTHESEHTPYGDSLARLAHPRKLALAFGHLLESLDPSRLPVHGGAATTVTVTIDYDTLVTGLGAAVIDNPLPGDGASTITAAQARRLACTAHLIPAVLGGDSEVLDLGRAQRLHSRAQRHAIRLRDKTCRAHGCDIPATWCEVHHLTPWSHGGHTTTHDAVVLCTHHHHRIHDPTYTHHRHPDGNIQFHRRL